MVNPTDERGGRRAAARPAPRQATYNEGGRLLARILEARGLSWANASRMLGRHPTYVRKLIVGERKPRVGAPRVDIRQTFGVPTRAWDQKPKGLVPLRPSGPVPAGAAA